MIYKDATHKPATIIPNKHMSTDNISDNSKLHFTEMDFYFLGYKHLKGLQWTYRVNLIRKSTIKIKLN